MSKFESLPRPKPHSPSDGSFESMLLVFCVVWILGSLTMLILCAFTLGPDWYRYWQLRRAGVTTSGQMIRQDVGDLWVSNIFQFSPPGDQTVYTGQQAIAVRHFEPILAGETVTIRYVAHNPSISVMESYFTTPFKPLLIFAGLGIVMLAIGLALLPSRWRAWRNVRRLYSEGHVVPATVVNLWRSANPGQQIVYCVAYKFEAAASTGRSQTILSAEVNELAFDWLRLRQQTPVRYLPDTPTVCCLEMEPIIQARLVK